MPVISECEHYAKWGGLIIFGYRLEYAIGENCRCGLNYGENRGFSNLVAVTYHYLSSMSNSVSSRVLAIYRDTAYKKFKEAHKV